MGSSEGLEDVFPKHQDSCTAVDGACMVTNESNKSLQAGGYSITGYQVRSRFCFSLCLWSSVPGDLHVYGMMIRIFHGPMCKLTGATTNVLLNIKQHKLCAVKAP